MLDKSKPYSQIYGTGAGKFEQNGVIFDNEGKPIDGEPQEIQEPQTIENDPKSPMSLQERMAIKDNKADGYLTKQDILKFLAALKEQYQLDTKFKATWNRNQLIATLEEVVDGLES